MCPVLYAKAAVARPKSFLIVLFAGTLAVLAYAAVRNPSLRVSDLGVLLMAPVMAFLGLIILKSQRDRKRLLMSEALKGAMLESSLDAIVSMDSSGRVIEFNPAAERMFGYKREKVMGHPMAELIIPPSLRKSHYDGVNRYVATRQAHVLGQRVELPAMRSDGTEFPVEIAICEIPGSSPLSFTGFLRDITDRRAAEDRAKRLHDQLESNVADRTEELHTANVELARSNKELEQFAYVASHDLKEPLRMVASYTQLLENKLKDSLDEDSRTFMGYVVDGVTRMNKLIDDLLSYSRVGRSETGMKPVHCKKVADSVVADFALVIAEMKARVDVGDLPTVFGNETELRELFQNLLQNSLKFHGSQPPEIRISAEKKDRWVFSVKDNGIGISPEFHEKIFVLFQRLNDRRLYPGTGIGLAICKKIVERHDGEIWVESQPGQGATFLFTLNADRRSPARTETLVS
jgi:PAS domain S-box-containing protein